MGVKKHDNVIAFNNGIVCSVCCINILKFYLPVVITVDQTL